MSFFSKISDTNNPDDTIESANEIKIGGMYTIEGSVYLCIYIGTESYRYPGRVDETDYEIREREANELVRRFDFIRIGTSTKKARDLSINEQKLNKYNIKKYSLFGGGKKKSKKSKKSKGSKKSRGSKKSKGSKKSRGKRSK